MDLLKLRSVFWRWRLLILSIVVVTLGAVALHVVTTPNRYQARARLQVTDRLDADVSVLDTGTRPTSTLRDDLTLFQNNFASVVASADVRSRTNDALHLGGQDAVYGASVSPVADSNFMDLVVSARTSDLAIQIVNAYATQAIRYYGELRAKPAAETKSVIAAQLPAARQAVLDAGAAPDGAPNTPEGQVARSTYQLLLEKYAQASLAAENAARVTYVQIAQSATDAMLPSLRRTLVTLGGFSVIGSLGLGVLLALVLESSFPLAPTPAAAPVVPLTVTPQPPIPEPLAPEPVRQQEEPAPSRVLREARAAANSYQPAAEPAGVGTMGGHLREWQGHYHRR